MMQIVNVRHFTFVGHILRAYAILSMLSDPSIWYSNKNPFILLTKLLLAIIIWLSYWMHNIIQCSKDCGPGGHYHVSWMCTVHHVEWIRVDANSWLAWMGDTPPLGKDGAHKWRRPCLSAHGLLNAKHWSVRSIIRVWHLLFHGFTNVLYDPMLGRVWPWWQLPCHKSVQYIMLSEKERQHQPIVVKINKRYSSTLYVKH